MKLRSLLALITQVQTANDISPIFITGGIARDKAIDKLNGTHLLKNISDIDLTTGDNSIHTLAKNLGIELGKSFSVKTRELDDGHSSIMLGKLKIDCSSNYLAPNIDKILKVIGIQNPSDLDKEMFSRDFTVNALLLSLDLKTIKDPTHQGIKDIKNKVLRTCLDPNITLKSNLNRIPRVFYLAAKLGFSVDLDIIKWIIQNKNLISRIKPGYLAKTMAKAFHYDADKTNQLIQDTGTGDVLKPQIKVASLVLKKNFDYEGINRIEMLQKRFEIFKKTHPHIIAYAYFAGHNDPFNEYMPPGIELEYRPGETDDDHIIGENALSAGDKDRTNSIPEELEGFRKDHKKILKRIKLRKILEDMGIDTSDIESDKVLLEGHPYSDDAFNQGVSGLFSYPLSYTGTIADNPNTIKDEYNDIPKDRLTMKLIDFADRYMKLAAKAHMDKRNHYIDLKGGGWGVIIHSKTPPEHRDKAFIKLDDGKSSEEFIDQVLNEQRDLKNHISYVCSIQSQDTVERLIQNDWQLPE